MTEQIFTPLNWTKTKRLTFNLEDVEVLEGDLDVRKLGKKAVVRIYGMDFKVVGMSCGLPHCHCDAYIIPIDLEVK